MMKKCRRFSVLLILAMLLAVLFAAPAYAGWQGGPGHWWWLNPSGTWPANGKATIGGEDYVFDENGYVVENDWTQMTSGKWYYSLGGGAVAKSMWIGDYYVGSDGAMLTDTWTPDGYYVGSNGKWDRSKGQKSGKKADVYVNIEGYWSNLTMPGYNERHRVDCRITNGSSTHCRMEFALYDIAGTGYSLYDDSNPNGDILRCYSEDGYHWTATSTLRDDSFTFEYNGQDQIILKWRNPSWLGWNDLIFTRSAASASVG